MNEELHAFLKSHRIDLLPEGDVSKLRDLQKQWLRWDDRSTQLVGTNIQPEFKKARAAFLENPTPANEQRLMILADPALTARRYAVLSQAFRDLCGKISGEAAAILTPHLDRIGLALKAEYDRRYEIAEPVLSNKRNHGSVKECQRWIDQIDRISVAVYHASGGKSDRSPSQLAEGLAVL